MYKGHSQDYIGSWQGNNPTAKLKISQAIITLVLTERYLRRWPWRKSMQVNLHEGIKLAYVDYLVSVVNKIEEEYARSVNRDFPC
ncbi:hypothetical protein [Candidatus Nitrotoga sp. HW29]|uniref:hypothetical protein n=1 Tax=Candidatus Nitrotoga sp. HW29 TaxID=2886963 RepID=UPI001EF37006|nr:hypothetical protein [Candidatus Nitrotoga sp. HW29]